MAADNPTTPKRDPKNPIPALTWEKMVKWGMAFCDCSRCGHFWQPNSLDDSRKCPNCGAK